MPTVTKQFYSTNKTGLLENLNTDDKNSFVGAINEVNAKTIITGSNSSITPYKDGYADLMDYGNYIKGKYYNATGELVSNNNIIGSTKPILIPQGCLLLEVSVEVENYGGAHITFWSSDLTFLSSAYIAKEVGTTLVPVPDGAKYFRIPFYNYTMHILVPIGLLLMHSQLKNEPCLSMQHFAYDTNTGVISPSRKRFISNVFSVDSFAVVYVINADDYKITLLEYTESGVELLGGWGSSYGLYPGHSYRIYFRRYDETLVTEVNPSELSNIEIQYGAAGIPSNGEYSSLTLSELRNSGYYFIRTIDVEVNDLPFDFQATSFVLKVERYATHSHNTTYCLQTIYTVNASPTMYIRYTRDTEEWCSWKKIGDVTGSSSVFADKKISIYGDSISTYVGWIPEGNATYYNGSNCGVTDVNQTWWKKVIDALGSTLLVNNSWSGRAVSSIRDSHPSHTTDAGYKEANVLQLKDDDVLPDVIVVYLGINDFNSGAILGDYDGSASLPTDPTKFLDAYAMMLNLIMTNYPLAQVYCCTLISCERTGGIGFPEINSNGDSIGEWNEGIKKLARAFGAKIIDFNSCGITYYNLSTYTGDYSSSTGGGLHPNAAGHSLIANQLIQELDNAVRTRY